jgi:hypothetical protein
VEALTEGQPGAAALRLRQGCLAERGKMVGSPQQRGCRGSRAKDRRARGRRAEVGSEGPQRGGQERIREGLIDLVL